MVIARPKILIVDDNPANRLAVRTILKGMDAELREAGNGFDALTMSMEEEYALILLDVHMPEMDGFEVCEQLRADPRTAETPVIFLTAAYKELADKVRGYVAGATDYLAKPIEDHILKAKVQVFLKLYNQHCLLQESNDFLRVAATVFESQEGMLVTDANNVILRVNNAFTRITGHQPEDVIGKNTRVLKSGRQSAYFYEVMWGELAQNGYWQGEIWNCRKNGEEYPCWLTISAVSNSDGKVTNYVGAFSDITSHKQAEEKIHNLAFYDPLTGLPNRRLLFDRIALAKASSVRNRNYGALMFLDLDNFKVLNDTRGHEMGDRLLVEVARRLQNGIRERDTIARFGGDEFVVMLDDLDADETRAVSQAEGVAEKLLSSLAEPYLLPISVRDSQTTIEHRCTASIGITLFHFQQDSMEEMLKRADAAMYQAKAAGRNVTRFFDPAMQKIVQMRSEMEAQLRNSLSNHELIPYYQLQVDTAGSPIGVEVLLRWNQPERGMVDPAEFISLAEDTGYIVPIGCWVLEHACQQLKQWQGNARLGKLSMAVNVSARQFKQSDFVDRVGAAITNAGIDPARLKLELTESVILDNVNDAVDKMFELKKIGVKISMDDFGTGYSSLSYLQRLPIDELKIDQSFVQDLIGSVSNKNIVKTIIGLANALNMGVIAEGVESREQFELLKDKGCKGFQGYLFSLPVPVAEFEALIAEH
ncbi:MAG: EAL domain-containing protein [Nitrosomonadales bacterium]|nr:EAL domain-containing protein [Nitrosomonadales bacterium]